MRYEEILDRFRIKRRNGNTTMCICPAHKDKEASLSVTRSEGKTLIHCHAGCDTEAVLGAVGLTVKDLYEETAKRETWRQYVEKREGRTIEAVYTYRDITTGKEAFTRLRLSGKKFLYGILEGDRFSYGLNGRERKTFPAVFGDINAIRKAGTVYYCEGEKDVLTVNSKGLCGVTCGASGDWTDAVGPLFTGKRVVILRDNDAPGEKLGAVVGEGLKGIARSVTAITPCTKAEHADVTDFFEAGGTVGQLLEMIPGPPKLESAADILKRDIQPVKHIVKGLLTEGVGLLAAQQKMGKTWMCYQLAASVASGQPFLDRDVTRGSVLYFDLEQSEQLRQERLRKMLGDDAPDNLFFIDHAAVIGEGFEEQLRGYLEEVPGVQLVIIDVLDMVADDQKRSESPKRHAYRNISALKKIAHDYRLGVVCVMHFRKMRDDDDFLSNISGSNGWSAAADFAVGITRKRGDMEAVLQTDGRTARSVSLQIAQDDMSMKWRVLGSVEDVLERRKIAGFRENAVTQAVVRVVMENGGKWTGTSAQLKATVVFDQDGDIPMTNRAITNYISSTIPLFKRVCGISVRDRNENNSKTTVWECVRLNDSMHM